MPEPADSPQIAGRDLLTLKYVPLSAAKKWDRNAKKHDIGALVTSIEIHGFRDPPAYDVQLDAVVEGNGRTEALEWMQAQGRERPRGIAEDASSGEWCIPILFGVDAKSRLAAERYGLDHNNLVMAGGDFTAVDMARNWGAEGYLAILQDLQAAKLLPVSVDSDDITAIINAANEDAPAAPSDGSLLELTNVTLAAPRHEVETGEVWTVGGHTLICIDVMRGWALWSTHLEGDTTLFVPYPGPFAPLTIRSEHHRMIMVQPDPYICGHILDRYADVHGEASIGKD